MAVPLPHEILSALALPALLIGHGQRVEVANAAAAELLGAGLVGRHFVVALRQPALVDAIERTLADGAPRSARFLAREGRADATYAAHVAPAGRSLLVSFEDRSATEEAGQMRRDFVANVSHEMKTPLTAILGYVETLRGPARDDDTARERFLTAVVREAQRMNRLVTDLLSLSRVEANERLRPRAEVDIAATLAACLQVLSGAAAAAGIALEFDRPEAPVTITGDADQLRQVFTNLVENAIKYGGARVVVRLSAPAMQDDLRRPGVAVEIADDGPGIHAIHLPRLTERFYRVDTHRSRTVGGTGLGLAIVKHIVSRHRGRLRIASEPGRGSTFTVILPRDP